MNAPHIETVNGISVGSADYKAHELAAWLRQYAEVEEDLDLVSYLLWAAEKLEACACISTGQE